MSIYLSRRRESFALDLMSYRSFLQMLAGAPYRLPQLFLGLRHHRHSQGKWRSQPLLEDHRAVTWDSRFGGNSTIPGIRQLVAPEIFALSDFEW